MLTAKRWFMKRHRRIDKTYTEDISQERPLKAYMPILIVFCVLFSLYALSLLFPLVWILFNSFKDKIDFQFRMWELTPIHAENYLFIFQRYNIFEMFFNSIILCLAVPTVNVFSSCCLAYGTARFKFKGNTALYYMGMSVMFINIAGTLPVSYRLMYDLHLIDTHIGFVLLTTGGLGFTFLVLHSMYTNVSTVYTEAALIEGAGQWRIFLTIITPQISSAVIAFWILSFIGVWNDYATQYLYLQNYPTLAVGVYEIRSDAQLTGDYPLLFATIIIVITPILILFAIFQKKLMALRMGGGIKE